MSNIKTECKHCIFATLENNIQNGCLAGQLEKYEDKGMTSSQFDTDKIYAVINGFCKFCRNEDWFAGYMDSGKGLTKLGAVDHIRDMIKIKYHAFMVAGNNLDDNITTINSLRDQSIKPAKLTVLRLPSNTLTPAQLIFRLKSAGLTWKIENIIDKELTVRQALDSLVSVDNKYPYYALFNAGINIPSRTFEALDVAINDFLQPIAVLRPNARGDGLFVNYTFQKYLFGSREKNIEDKLECPSIHDIFSEFPE